MPFLAQGKTNWKYILIVLILAVIVGGGILVWVKTKEVTSPKLPKIEKPEKGTSCDERCKSLGYISGECRGFKTIPEISGKKCEENEIDIGLSHVTDCAEIGIGTGVTCCCKVKEDETANWKTYRNEEYGFEIKYPREGWEPREGRYEELYLERIEILIPYLEPIQNIPKEALEERIPESAIKGEMAELGSIILDIGVAENPSGLPIEKWFQEYFNLRYKGLEEYKPKKLPQVEDFILAGIKGVKTSLVALPPVAGGCHSMIYLPKNSKVYSVGFCNYEAWYYSNLEIDAEEKEKEELILSTFRFLE